MKWFKPGSWLRANGVTYEMLEVLAERRDKGYCLLLVTQLLVMDKAQWELCFDGCEGSKHWLVVKKGQFEVSPDCNGKWLKVK